MELVLNKCYGGFGLSHAAKMKILEKKELQFFLIWMWKLLILEKVNIKRFLIKSLKKLATRILTLLTFRTTLVKDEIVVDWRDINRADYK